VLASRTGAEVEEAAAEARASGAAALAATVDLMSVASIDRLIETAVARFGRVDVLINNAGTYVNRPALEMTEADWDLMADTNLKGLFFCASRAARVMVEQRSGCVINLSSALATVAQQGYACYGATKAGVQQLTRVLALEWAPHGITVNAIAPTTTETPAASARLRTPEALTRAREKIPLGRYGWPEDVVGAALYLASPAARFMTGQTLLIDGGFSLP
jgi:2-deoxy-D-gluconate 3-dehydrogenase